MNSYEKVHSLRNKDPPTRIFTRARLLRFLFSCCTEPNNRAEEAIGSAHDFQVAYREGAFGAHPRPFLGWLMLVEDAPGSRTPVRDVASHFRVFAAFQGASYIQRYAVLCQRLTQEQLYSAACVIASPRTAVADGEYVELDALTSLRALVTTFAAHVAAEAARS